MEKFIYTKENPLRVCTLCSGYDSQCYKLAGNSITTKVMEEIFRNLFSVEEEDHTTLF